MKQSRQNRLGRLAICTSLLIAGIVAAHANQSQAGQKSPDAAPTVATAPALVPVDAQSEATLKPEPVLASDDTIDGRQLNIAIYTANFAEENVATSFSSLVGKTYAPASETDHKALLAKHSGAISQATAKWSAELKLDPTKLRVKSLMLSKQIASTASAQNTGG